MSSKMSVKTCFIFGENHHVRDSVETIEREIKRLKPDYVLHELLYEDVIDNKQEARKRLSHCRIGGHQCDPSINKDVYELAYKLDIPFIGIDLEDVPQHYSLKNKFLLREKHMVEKIKEYLGKGKIVVIVGDTHLRTIRTNELGDASLIYKEFRFDNKVKIERSKYKEIR